MWSKNLPLCSLGEWCPCVCRCVSTRLCVAPHKPTQVTRGNSCGWTAEWFPPPTSPDHPSPHSIQQGQSRRNERFGSSAKFHQVNKLWPRQLESQNALKVAASLTVADGKTTNNQPTELIMNKYQQRIVVKSQSSSFQPHPPPPTSLPEHSE